MATTREIACVYYFAEGQCLKGRVGTFYHQCQHCDLYRPIKGGRPARKNLKKEKNDKFMRDKRNFEW